MCYKCKTIEVVKLKGCGKQFINFLFSPSPFPPPLTLPSTFHPPKPNTWQLLSRTTSSLVSSPFLQLWEFSSSSSWDLCHEGYGNWVVADCVISILKKHGLCIPYSRKFSRGPNFRDFHDPQPKCENKNRENFVNFCVNFRTHRNFHACVLCASLGRSDDGTVPIQTGRRRPTLSHRTSSVPVIPAT